MLILNLGILYNIIPDYNPRTLVPCLKKISFGMLAPAIKLTESPAPWWKFWKKS